MEGEFFLQRLRTLSACGHSSLQDLAHVTVRDRMFLGMQDFDFAQILGKFIQILPEFAQILLKFVQISPNFAPNFF